MPEFRFALHLGICFLSVQRKLLAFRTIMRAALPNKYTFNFCAADRTFLVGAPIDSKIEFATAIDPIEGSAIATDAFIQYVMDRFMQGLCLTFGKRIGKQEWMQFRKV